MHLLLAPPDDQAVLELECRRALPAAPLESLFPGVWAWKTGQDKDAPPPPLAFIRQILPNAQFARAGSIRAWAELLAEAALASLPERKPWRLHLLPVYGDRHAGRHRCILIQDCLREGLNQRRRELLKHWGEATTPFDTHTSLLQLALTQPDKGFLSVTSAPLPSRWPHLLSPFPGGDIAVAVDKQAPSRAFAKLLEAEQRLGQAISSGQHCIDLGASPGSWTYIAAQRGAHVLAVDRSPLRHDLLHAPRVQFRRADAFRFQPLGPVDWLLCDVVAAPQRSAQLLLDWLRSGRARRFVVTLKFRGDTDLDVLDTLKRALPALCTRWHLQRLCANHHEACAFGVAQTSSAPPASPHLT